MEDVKGSEIGEVDRGKSDYSSWSQEKLIERVTLLENKLKVKNSSLTRQTSDDDALSKPPRAERLFNPSKYSTRLVAFKLAYLGKRYNGFECQKSATRLPTIEEELWKAFNKGRLIFPNISNPLKPGEVNWEGCEYSKCGRTDKGVSAFGQVIGIRVRSNRPLGKRKEKNIHDDFGQGGLAVDEIPAPAEPSSDGGFNTYARNNSVEMASPALAPSRLSEEDLPTSELDLSDPDFEEAFNFDPIADEIGYCSLLNRLLPPDIRILAWCPAPPQDFSARFSCRERQYRYFFTQPAFMPTPTQLELPNLKSYIPPEGKMRDGWLDIEKMREAAKLFEGEHDFRNFCKVDPGKQISNFDRRIFHADIKEVDDATSGLSFLNRAALAPSSLQNGNPKIYTFTLHGSAFLWHQVRHMVAVLFLVGQGLEKPSIVSDLLDVKKYPGRPAYEMASDTPLVLWNCVFPHEDDPERKDAIQWHYVGDDTGTGDHKYGTAGIMDELWNVWRERKIDEMLASTLLNVVAKQGMDAAELTVMRRKGTRSQKVFDGSDQPRMAGNYIPVINKIKMDSVEVINERYAVRKGFESSAEMKLLGFRRLNNPVAAGNESIVEEANE
ncbi:related to pseudouridine synthase 3 [Rhynchosporium agropyri]|uniref:Related to pseudouridine synthase 3 n=1 Tax=Rhynchosporium agropyri TaxID=914238 RepID=A0A1E1LFR1_9HELO|nr:related to pseudouridine synthase 3 [Rhynchosporium agropyri]